MKIAIIFTALIALTFAQQQCYCVIREDFGGTVLKDYHGIGAASSVSACRTLCINHVKADTTLISSYDQFCGQLNPPISWAITQTWVQQMHVQGAACLGSNSCPSSGAGQWSRFNIGYETSFDDANFQYCQRQCTCATGWFDPNRDTCVEGVTPVPGIGYSGTIGSGPYWVHADVLYKDIGGESNCIWKNRYW
eukprot:TRINITY_DN350_c0_g1_i1.p1 TRINITY_DN350_c0_g1~~TRINITY_DN350_c0_g1_i1.p1  ORF type:complete len:193 (-),score=33.57 TRINITY_DN350_c0_g1_i1:35-613(-)